MKAKGLPVTYAVFPTKDTALPGLRTMSPLMESPKVTCKPVSAGGTNRWVMAAAIFMRLAEGMMLDIVRVTRAPSSDV